MDTYPLDEKLTRLEEMLRQQQAEIATLRELLDQKKSNQAILSSPGSPARSNLPDTSRRKLLKQLGLALLAGGAAISLEATTAQARISVNPNPNVGAIITRNGSTVTGIPSGFNYGLIASETSVDVSTISTGFNVGISGYSSKNGVGVYGHSSGADSTAVYGKTDSGVGVIGTSISSYGILGSSTSGQGVVGVSVTNQGVVGNSTSDAGVKGVSNSGDGVQGYSGTGFGVFGQTNSTTQGGVVAANTNTNGPALQIDQGGIKVLGAGINSQTTAFIHYTTVSNVTNNASRFSNPLTDNNPNALLFVTHLYYAQAGQTAGTYENRSFGVSYNFNLNQWTIYHEDSSMNMSPGLYFNVLVIIP